jgi:hypothetical protein
MVREIMEVYNQTILNKIFGTKTINFTRTSYKQLH